MITTGARWTAGWAIVGAALVVGGCTADEGSGPDDSPTTSTTAPASDGAVPTTPALPPEATVLDRPGAESFVKHWWTLVNYANATGDTNPMEGLASADCTSCVSLTEQARGFHKNGNSLRGGEVTTLVAVAAPIENDLVLVTNTIHQAAGAVLAADGTVVRELPENGSRTLAFYAEITDGKWRVFDFAAQEES